MPSTSNLTGPKASNPTPGRLKTPNTEPSSSSQASGNDVPPALSRGGSFSAKLKNMLQQPLTHYERKREEKQQKEQAEREADIEAFLRSGRPYREQGERRDRKL